jgi:hypothetical protein
LVAALRGVAVTACLALFVHALATADLAAAWHRIRAIGPEALLVLVPFPIGLAFDSAAWSRLLAGIERRVRVRTLWRIRFATEAVVNSAPVGAVWAEAIAPVLVARRSEATAADAFAASTAKRWLIVRTHGSYVALATALGADAISRASTTLFGGSHWLPLVVLAGALVLVGLSFGFEWIATKGAIAGRVSGALGSARFLRMTAWIAERRHQFEHADAQLRRLGEDTRAAAGAELRIAGLWLMEGLETFVILRLLGADLGFVDVISFDAALSVVRSAAVFAPAGIGVQDVGYIAVLGAYGVPEASGIGPAFVVIKRAKEVLYILLGLVILARSGVRRRDVAQGLAQADPAAT